MTKRYSIAEARANLPTIVDQVEAGREIELTRRGKPVVVVVSLGEFERMRGERAAFRDVYSRFLKTHPLNKIGLDRRGLNPARAAAPGRKVAL